MITAANRSSKEVINSLRRNIFTGRSFQALCKAPNAPKKISDMARLKIIKPPSTKYLEKNRLVTACTKHMNTETIKMIRRVNKVWALYDSTLSNTISFPYQVGSYFYGSTIQQY